MSIARRKNQPVFDVDPDEIFLDSKNLPEFDRARFEGQMELAVSKKSVYFLVLFFVIIAALYVFRLGFIQIAQGSIFAARSRDNNLNQIVIFTSRGNILDRNSEPLAWNSPERSYLKKSGFGHILGYVSLPDSQDLASGRARGSRELVGKDGVEEAYNEILRGQLGQKIQEVNVHGQIISESVQLSPLSGLDLVLTIDQKLQSALFEIIAQLAEERGFLAGAGVIMDVSSGEILALTNYPEYNPNLLSGGNTSTSTLALLVDDPKTPFLNRVVSGLYAPGSIIKPIIAAAALQEGLVTPEKLIVSEGSISIANPFIPGQFSVFHDWKAHGSINLTQALAVSSNVYFYALGGGWQDQPGLGIEKIARYCQLFGLGAPTGIGLSDEEVGVVPTPDWKAANFQDGRWRLGDTYNTSIGQYGFQVTPIQVVRFMAGLATGRLPRPKIIKNEPSEFEDLAFDRWVLEEVRKGLRLSVTAGTGQALNLPELEISAKTGTAEIGISKKMVNSWVTGFYPSGNPRWAFALVMEKGPRGNLVGAPAAARQFFEKLKFEAPEYFVNN